MAAFDAKVAKAQAAAASDGQPVLSFFPTDWDKKRYKPAPELVVLETKPGVPPDTHLQIFIDDSLAKSGPRTSPAGHRRRSPSSWIRRSSSTRSNASAECNPDYYNPHPFRTQHGVPFANFKKAVSVIDVTDPAHETPVKPAEPKRD